MDDNALQWVKNKGDRLMGAASWHLANSYVYIGIAPGGQRAKDRWKWMKMVAIVHFYIYKMPSLVLEVEDPAQRETCIVLWNKLRQS